MSKPVNTVAIGAFVTVALFFLLSALFYLSGNVFNRNTVLGLMVFDGSLRGLKVGAPIAFKGVQIGEVIDFDVIVDNETYNVLTPVVVRVKSDRIRQTSENRETLNVRQLIDHGLRAQLQVQSLLTGLLYIQLDFYKEQEARFTASELAKYEIPDKYTVIPTIPRDLERLSRSLEDIDFKQLVESFTATMSGMDRFITDPEFQNLPENINATLASLEQLSNQLDARIAALSPGVEQLVTESGQAMAIINRELPEISADAKQSMQELATALKSAQATLGNVDYLLSDDSAVMYDIRNAAQELTRAGRALQSLAETLDTQPESLLKGKAKSGN